jgi:hypothetical protein
MQDTASPSCFVILKRSDLPAAVYFMTVCFELSQ